MSVSKEQIFAIASELSDLIKDSDYFSEYKKLSIAISQDKTAQNLLDKLYKVGQELSGIPSDDSILQSASEKDFINKELNENKKVKDFLMAQKKYLYLIEQVIEKIKKPD